MNLLRLRPAKGGKNIQALLLAECLFFDMEQQINKNLNRAVVGIAGLGGLGSNVAVALCRTGIGKLIIADFDKVEPPNLNRQHYFADQIGKNKVDATIENLRRINPEVEVTGFSQKLNPDNLLKIFAQADIIAECFDKPQQKQMIVETVLTKTPKTVIVSVSGLAGYGNSNAIKTCYITDRFVLVGDGETGIEDNPILTAARVGIAAAHQANAVVEILIDSF